MIGKMIARILELSFEEARVERRRMVAVRKARRLKQEKRALIALVEKEAPRVEAEGEEHAVRVAKWIRNMPHDRKQKREGGAE